MQAANLSERLAKVEAAKAKKEEQEAALKAKTKEEMEAKLGKTEEKRIAHMTETKEKLGEHLARFYITQFLLFIEFHFVVDPIQYTTTKVMIKHRVERAQKDLEIQTEAARLSAEFALNAKMIKVVIVISYNMLLS